jgi:hypothetical protein
MASPREILDDYLKLSGQVIPRGTPLTRVATTQDMKILDQLRPGDTRVLDRYLSTTDPNSTDFINKMIVGDSPTGGRDLMGRNAFPQMNFDIVGDVPGVYDMNKLVRPEFGNTVGTDVIDGLLGRGTSMRLRDITRAQHPRLDQPDVLDWHDVYNFEVGPGIDAKEGFLAKYLSTIMEDFPRY